MRIRLIAGALALAALAVASSGAEARRAPSWQQIPDEWRKIDGRYDWSTAPTFFKAKRHVKRKAKSVKRKPAHVKRKPAIVKRGPVAAVGSVKLDVTLTPTITGYSAAIAKSSKVADLVPALGAKVSAIISDCGSRLVSGFRRGALIAGSGRPSLHSRYPSQAADLQGNPSCIYKHLAGWPGGYSTDYARVKHVHVSLASDRRERGARFVHYGSRRYARAKARTYRYAYYRQPRWDRWVYARPY